MLSKSSVLSKTLRKIFLRQKFLHMWGAQNFFAPRAAPKKNLRCAPCRPKDKFEMRPNVPEESFFLCTHAAPKKFQCQAWVWITKFLGSGSKIRSKKTGTWGKPLKLRFLRDLLVKIFGAPLGRKLAFLWGAIPLVPI